MFSPIFATSTTSWPTVWSVLDERLLEQHRLGVELLELAVDDLPTTPAACRRPGPARGDRALALEDVRHLSRLTKRGSAAAMCIATS
jgi:hypothetical protein